MQNLFNSSLCLDSDINIPLPLRRHFSRLRSSNLVLLSRPSLSNFGSPARHSLLLEFFLLKIEYLLGVVLLVQGMIGDCIYCFPAGAQKGTDIGGFIVGGA